MLESHKERYKYAKNVQGGLDGIILPPLPLHLEMLNSRWAYILHFYFYIKKINYTANCNCLKNAFLNHMKQNILGKNILNYS